STGVALCHHNAILRHKLGAKAAHGFVGGALFRVNGFGFFDHREFDFREVGSLRRKFVESTAHAGERPEKINAGGARLGGGVEGGEEGGEVRGKVIERFGRGVSYTDGDAHGCSDSDGGSPANNHFADGFGHVLVSGVGVCDFLGGKAALVEHDDAAVGPFNRL